MTRLFKKRLKSYSSLRESSLGKKGSSVFKKDKEFELLKKKIPEVILKLDDILVEREKFPVAQDDHDELYSLKERIDILLSENQHLREMLSEKIEEDESLTVNQISIHSLAESKFLRQIKKLKRALEDLKVAASIQGDIHSVIFKQMFNESKYAMEDLEIEASIVQSIYTVALRGFIGDGMSSLKTVLSEKERSLLAEDEVKKKLKETISSLSTLIKEKEHDNAETGFKFMQQKQQFDLLNQEICVLREQITNQEVLISDSKMKSDRIRWRLEEALRQIHESEMEMKKLNKKLSTVSVALEEAEKQKTVLHDIIEDRERRLPSSMTKEKQHTKDIHSIVTSLTELSEASVDFENKLTKNIERNQTRLKILSRQWGQIMQQADLLTKKTLLYKEMLEIRSSNLQKAEAEVDLLGDEVDTLLSLLGKTYVALDHYSPVLQHYPGVMEILNLVQRELVGEMNRSA